MRVAVAGRAAAAEVWDRFTRPARWPSWAPHIRAVECADDVIVAGTSGVVRGPWPLRVRFVVTEVDVRVQRWRWRAGPVEMRHGVQAAGSGSRAWVELPAAVAIPYYPLLRWALTRLVRPGDVEGT